MKKKPFYQILIQSLVAILAGYVALGAFFGAVNDSIALSATIPLKITYVLTVVVVIVWILSEIHAKLYGFVWISNNKIYRKNSFTLGFRLWFIGALLLLCTPHIVDFTRSFSVKQIPKKPNNIELYPDAIADFLNADAENVKKLEELLQAWGITLPQSVRVEGQLVSINDVDNDTGSEIVVAIPGKGDFVATRERPSYLVVFYKKFDKYHSSIYEWDSQLVFVWRIIDINNDKKTEIITQSINCGAHTCFLTVNIFRWSSTKGFQDLLVSKNLDNTSIANPQVEFAGASISYGRAIFSDINEDKGLELLMEGGTIGSVGAGLQRAHTEIYGWDGSKYRLKDIKNDPIISRHPYFRVIDGNKALDKRDIINAQEYYRAALNEKPSPDKSDESAWSAAKETQIILAFARFRLFIMCIHQACEQVDAIYNESQELDGVYAIWTKTFWEYYKPNTDWKVACLKTNEAQVDMSPLQEFVGYNTPILGNVCPENWP